MRTSWHGEIYGMDGIGTAFGDHCLAIVINKLVRHRSALKQNEAGKRQNHSPNDPFLSEDKVDF